MFLANANRLDDKKEAAQLISKAKEQLKQQPSNSHKYMKINFILGSALLLSQPLYAQNKEAKDQYKAIKTIT